MSSRPVRASLPLIFESNFDPSLVHCALCYSLFPFGFCAVFAAEIVASVRALHKQLERSTTVNKKQRRPRPNA